MSYSGRTLGHSSTSARPDPSEAAAIAALSRSTASLSLADEDDSKPSYWERRDWQRLIDDSLIAKSTREQAIETLKTLIKLVEGAKALPFEGQTGTERTRTVRLRNSIVERTIVRVPGARTVVEFEERLTLPVAATRKAFETSQSRLTTARSVLTSSLDALRRRAELTRAAHAAATEDNARRIERVVAAIRDDRLRVREQHERKKHSQRAKDPDQAGRDS
ncbi:hypothetical protein JCM11491_002211 [Sporobolomyces phaffii]